VTPRSPLISEKEEEEGEETREETVQITTLHTSTDVRCIAHRGTCLTSGSGLYCGNSYARNSCSWLTPGHVNSLGVPSNFTIRCSCSSTAEPANSGRPEAISKNIHPTPLQQPHTAAGNLYHLNTIMM